MRSVPASSVGTPRTSTIPKRRIARKSSTNDEFGTAGEPRLNDPCVDGKGGEETIASYSKQGVSGRENTSAPHNTLLGLSRHLCRRVRASGDVQWPRSHSTGIFISCLSCSRPLSSTKCTLSSSLPSSSKTSARATRMSFGTRYVSNFGDEGRRRQKWDDDH